MTQSGRGLKHFFSVTLHNFQKSVCVCVGGGGGGCYEFRSGDRLLVT